MKENHLLSFENVSFSYDDPPTENFAVKNIDLDINKGEFVVILGHNGSGKSTLAKLSNSIYVPTCGKVFVDGMDTANTSLETAIRKKVGVVFQNPDNQLVSSIVEEDVAFGPENLSLLPEEIRKRVDDALKAVGMFDYRFHETHRLSGGQKQRVAIAGIIAMRPECIVLDEPTAMLDPHGRAEVIKTVKRLNREMGISIVLITHFMEEAVNADRVVIVDGGQIRIDDIPENVFSDRRLLKECGLDVPMIADINERLIAKGIKMPANIIREEDFIDAFVALL